MKFTLIEMITLLALTILFMLYNFHEQKTINLEGDMVVRPVLDLRK